MVEENFEEYVKNQLKNMYDKEFLETVTGPDIYGPGNFEVYFENNQWEIRPVEGWTPAEPRGIVTDEAEGFFDRVHEVDEIVQKANRKE
jgi:hypothetical protein